MVTLRPMQPQEASTVKSLILKGLAQRFDQLRPELNPDIDDIQAHYVDNGATVLVALENDEIIGCGMLTKDSSAARIVRMSVRADYQGRGIGRQIGEALIAAARQRGFSVVLVETNQDWHSARQLYERLGFTFDYYTDEEVHMKLSLDDYDV